MLYPRAGLIAASLSLAGAAAAETVDRAAKANTPTVIAGFFSYWVDTCEHGEIPNVTVRQTPANGSLAVQMRETALGQNSRCPGARVRGPIVVYTPKKGFRGQDEAVVDVPITSNDARAPTIRTYTYRIRVE
jgi:hypothetical protein